VEQPLSEFYVEAEARGTARRGKRPTIPCRDCQAAAYRARRKPRQDYIDKIKVESGCADCGLVPEVLEVLEFDHRPDEDKKNDVSNMMASGTWQAFVDEVAKCDVVCANCHRVRTVGRRQLGARRGIPNDRPSQRAKDAVAGLAHIWGPAVPAVA
jgi:hypothetical protein